MEPWGGAARPRVPQPPGGAGAAAGGGTRAGGGARAGSWALGGSEGSQPAEGSSAGAELFATALGPLCLRHLHVLSGLVEESWCQGRKKY